MSAPFNKHEQNKQQAASSDTKLTADQQHSCNHDDQQHDDSHTHYRHDHNHSDNDQQSNAHAHSHQGHSHSHSHQHAHGHDHHHGGLLHHHGPADGNRTGLIIALSITVSIMVLEFIGGLITNSLALLSDSGHMLSDSSSLVFSLIAFGLAAKAATPKRTFGNHRFEILAALLNAVTLFVVAAIIIIEAIERFAAPPTVASATMLWIASIGLAANLLSAYFLMKKGDVEHNLNMRSAYLHVVGDALGSIGAIVAGIIMLNFEWYYADPIISVVVALLILRSAWGVLKQSLHILMEGTPMTIDQQSVYSSLAQLPQVVDVHDLHIWTITSNFDSLSCHLVVEEGTDEQQVLRQAIQLVKEQYGIAHSTIQIETKALDHEPCTI